MIAMNWISYIQYHEADTTGYSENGYNEIKFYTSNIKMSTWCRRWIPFTKGQ